MKPDASAEERFNGWYVKAIEKLKELPEGDGAFAALMVTLPLYERLVIAKLKLESKPTGEEDIKQAISGDLGLTNSERSIFWAIFRVGFMHQAMGQSGATQWLVGGAFGALPEFRELKGKRCVCVDPWKFADRVLSAFVADPRLITASESFPLASVHSFPVDAIPPPIPSSSGSQ